MVGDVLVAASEPEVALPGEDTTCCWLSCCRSVAWLASCCCCLSSGSSSAPPAAVWFRRREVVEAREFPEPKLCRWSSSAWQKFSRELGPECIILFWMTQVVRSLDHSFWLRARSSWPDPRPPPCWMRWMYSIVISSISALSSFLLP